LIIKLTCCISIPLPTKSVAIKILEEPDLNYFIILTLSLIYISPWIAETTNLFSFNFSDNSLTLYFLFVKTIHWVITITLVKLNQSSKLLTVFFHWNIKLFNTVQCKLFIFKQNFDWIFHEFISHLYNMRRHGGWEKTNLDVRWKVSKNEFNVINKSSIKHLICFV